MCTPHRDLAILWVLDLIPCARARHFPVIHNDFAQNQNNQPQKHMFFIGICERWSWSVCSRHIFSIMFSKRFEQCRTSRLQNINFSNGFVSAGLYPLCSRYAITHWRTTNIRKHMCKWILDRGTWPICSRIAFSIVSWAYSTKSMRFQVFSDPQEDAGVLSLLSLNKNTQGSRTVPTTPQLLHRPSNTAVPPSSSPPTARNMKTQPQRRMG